MVNVLVTGGLGVNGSSVTRRLLERGHLPIVLENRPDTSLVADIADRFPIVTGDITDLGGLLDVAREHSVERVVHMAALMPGQAQADPRLGFSVNAVGGGTSSRWPGWRVSAGSSSPAPRPPTAR